MARQGRISRRGLLGAAAVLGTTGLVGRPTSARAASRRHRAGGPAARLPSRSEFVVRGAHVLTMDPALGDLPRGDVHVRDGVIVAVGTDLAAPGAAVLDGRDTIALPGFVDTHWHLWTSSLRALIRNDEAPAYGYFAVTPRVGLEYTPEDAYRAVRLGLAEGLYSGITTVHDWSHNILSPAHADADLRALADVGIRARFSYGYSRQLQLEPELPMDVADIARVQREWTARPNDGLLTLGMASRGVDLGQPGATPFRVLRRDWDGTRALGLPITLHVGRAREVTALEQEGLLGPDVQLVHPTSTTAAERELLAERGTSFSSSPHTELRRLQEAGDAQVAELLEAGVQVSLSVDHIAGLNCDFFSTMRTLHWMHSHRIGDRVPLSTRRLVELATIEGARDLGLAEQIGSLTPGKRADLILVRTTDANIAPVHEPTHALVFAAQPRNVDTVVIDGRILLRGGQLTALDEEQVVREAVESAAALHLRAGWP
jgi:5-methylthioadenosine/S-adenosylhomocysteine deaminase